ncbi:MAG TPA: hypothetical protein VFJ63_03885 [Candidatus Bathyarchaeia archaeon]|nr:hypothetical protein [Candidatus Bathyarchaeia archaeon]
MKLQLPNWEGLTGVRGFIQRRPWSVLSWASGIVALTFISYYGILALSNPPNVIGQQFVLQEFPPQSISPWFFAKPITWFSYASFLYWAFGLEAQKSHFLRFSDRTRRFLSIVTAVIAFGALYEIFFNFMLWSALEVLCNSASPSPCTPDLINNPWPNLRNPLSLTFSTKVVTLVFALAVYSLYYLHRIDKEIDRKTPTPAFLYPRQERFESETIKNLPLTRSFAFDPQKNDERPQEVSPPT